MKAATTPPFHPASRHYPLMSEQELAALADDIEKNGQRLPIVLTAPLERYGQIIDGRNRFLACQLKGITPVYEIFKGKPEDIEAASQSLNEHRRHLDPAWLAEKRKERIGRVAEKRREGKSTRKIAEEVGVSQMQVVRDLKEATETGVSVEPESGKVEGKDGKQRRTRRMSPTQKAAAEARAAMGANRRKPGKPPPPHFLPSETEFVIAWMRKRREWWPDSMRDSFIGFIRRMADALECEDNVGRGRTEKEQTQE